MIGGVMEGDRDGMHRRTWLLPDQQKTLCEDSTRRSTKGGGQHT